jgi:hypothetical protein
MKWPWVRPIEETQKELDETERVKQRLRIVMEDLRETLNEAEKVIEKGTNL